MSLGMRRTLGMGCRCQGERREEHMCGGNATWSIEAEV
jgi:hypothetical protein